MFAIRDAVIESTSGRPSAGPQAPRAVVTAIPAAKAKAAQTAAPRSSGGRAGQTHGVVQY